MVYILKVKLAKCLSVPKYNSDTSMSKRLVCLFTRKNSDKRLSLLTFILMFIGRYIIDLKTTNRKIGD